MKSIMSVAAGMLVVAVVTPVRAADLPVPAKEPVVVSSTPWTGFYIGGNLGGAWGHIDYNAATSVPSSPPSPPFLTTTGSYAPSGFFAGGQAGFNWEFQNHIVVGAEADLEFSDITGSTTAAGAAGNVNTTNFGTLEARLGYAFGNLLIYAAGGGAWTNTKSSVTFAGNTGSDIAMPAGYSFGGGLEWLVLPNWTVRAEYMHLLFRGVPDTYDLASGGVTSYIVSSQGSVDVDLARVGVSYLWTLNPPAVTARY